VHQYLALLQGQSQLNQRIAALCLLGPPVPKVPLLRRGKYSLAYTQPANQRYFADNQAVEDAVNDAAASQRIGGSTCSNFQADQVGEAWKLASELAIAVK
jgi:hypothetical protein